MEDVSRKEQVLLTRGSLVQHHCVCPSWEQHIWDLPSLPQKVGLSRVGKGSRNSIMLCLRLLSVSHEVARISLKY